jgi:hypothetical protein
MGIPNPKVIAPEGYKLDAALMARPGNVDVQLDLFLDYANNVKLYPSFQEYFRKWRPLLLAIWGKNDLYFIPAGAEAFRRDNPNATVQFLDTGHFALETHFEEIAMAMRDFLQNCRIIRPNEFLFLASLAQNSDTVHMSADIVPGTGFRYYQVTDRTGKCRQCRPTFGRNTNAPTPRSRQPSRLVFCTNGSALPTAERERTATPSARLFRAHVPARNTLLPAMQS